MEFEFTQNNQEDVTLYYDTDDLDLQGVCYFTKLIADVGIGEAIEIVAGDFWKEAETNAASLLLGATNPYFIELLRGHEDVIMRAENAAIETYKGV